MKIRANAKINLGLQVLDKLGNGFHTLDMLMAPISLYDEIDISIRKDGLVKINIVNDSQIDWQNNTIVKAITVMRNAYNFIEGFDIHLVKNIPSQAGLGGGSSDAAFVMLAINELLKLDISLEELAKIAVLVGTDVPFFIYNKIARVSGIGEKIQLLDLDFEPYILLVKPKVGVSTKECFELYDSNPKIEITKIDDLISAIKNKDNLQNYLMNSLLEPAVQMQPVIKKIIDELISLGLNETMMSGSGSCIFSLGRDYERLKKVEEKLQLEDWFVGVYRII